MLNQDRLDQAFQRLQAYPQREAALDDRFRQMIMTAHDDDLNRINAHRLAGAWNRPVRAVLTWMLHACQVGLFELHWETHCPMCDDINESSLYVGVMRQDLKCRTCYNEFHLHFDENTEVTFSISPSIRRTQPGVMVYAPYGSFTLGEYDTAEPFEVIFDRTDPYFLISPQAQMPFVAFLMDNQLPPVEMITVTFAPDTPLERINVPPGRTLVRVLNQEHVILGYIDEYERAYGARIRGLELAILPTFQQLFATKTLSQRESLSIRSLTVLFTDITGSTALYQRLGDVLAYNLVRDHFEVLFSEIEQFRGGVVKTIGDAVMAVFITPEDAVQAALAVQKAIHGFNSGRSLEEGLILVKIGIHTGSAIAVHLNDRMDYFGNMVNLAARIQGQSRSAEILLSEAVYRDPSVQALVQTSPDIRVSESVFELAGIEQAQHLYSLATLVE